MMSLFRRIASYSVILCLLFQSSAFASKGKASTTPVPPDVPAEIIREIPVIIQQLLDLAHEELIEVNGENLKEQNKYTKWRNNGKWGWCGGFITWCMLELGVPQ